LSPEQRKRLLALACACDRLELQLLHQRRPADEPPSLLGSAARIWPLLGVVGRLMRWGRAGKKFSTAAKWLRFAGPIAALFV
jgi:hypothetical protein